MNKKTIITALFALVAMAGQGQKIPQDWFKTDTITVQGRIEDYDTKKFGFTTMKCHLYDVIVKDNSTLLLEIEPDGTFAKSFPISYPMKLSFTATEKSKVGFEKILFFARPGEAIDITIKPNEYGQYECHYNSGSSKDVERWLNSDLQLLKMCSRLYDF